MVGKIWEDKWEYEKNTYFVGDPLFLPEEVEDRAVFALRKALKPEAYTCLTSRCFYKC